MKCKYIFKKGIHKGTICNEVMCKKHQLQHPEKASILSSSDTSLEILKKKVAALNTTNINKQVVLKHINNLSYLEPSSQEFYKNKLYIDLALKFPYNTVKPITPSQDLSKFLINVSCILDKHIVGMSFVKNQIINLVCKMITNPYSKRNIIALHGKAGIGKTKLVEAIAECLNLPVRTISLGGIKDVSFFTGHGYVYVESGPGKIIQNVISTEISNPILYFDELDKVSFTNHGKDIYSFLSYLTDPSQNVKFTDQYFYGMEFDLSKVFYIFTFNDISVIDKVLLDRLNVVYVSEPSIDEKVDILIGQCLPDIIQNIGLQFKIDIPKAVVRAFITKYNNVFDNRYSSGIREYYRIMEQVLLEVNKRNLSQSLVVKNDIYYLDHQTFFGIIEKVYKPDISNDVPIFMYI